MKNFFRHFITNGKSEQKNSCAKLPAHLGNILLDNFLKRIGTKLEEPEVNAACSLIETRLESLQLELDRIGNDPEKKYEVISQALLNIEAELVSKIADYRPDVD